VSIQTTKKLKEYDPHNYSGEDTNLSNPNYKIPVDDSEAIFN
jgi:hypothetical protein